ncbi:MAG: response regulator [Coriobacteriia bacterium]|nr:response regulator [Coriobacteriia bacterium]
MDETRNERRALTHVRALMSHTGEGFIALTPAGDVRLMNEVAEEILGRTRDESIDKPVEELGVVVLAETARAVIAAADCSTPQSVSLTLGDRDLLCTVAPYHDQDSCGVVMTIRDQSELTRSRKRAEAILQSTADGLIVYSSQGLITFVNNTALLMLGLAVGDLLDTDHDLWSIFGLDPLDTFDPQRGGSQVREVTLEKPVHRVIDVRTDPVIDDHGVYLGFVATIHDVTAEREIGQMKNEFVSTVSHELRTPLTSIKGYVDLILDEEAGEINDTQREFLSIVKENSDRLVNLINDLLDISRIESGRVHLKVQPLQLTERIRGAVDTFRAVLEQTGRTITVEVPDDLPPAAGDPDRVGQVLINFISNAIKYSPEGGNVWVRVEADDEFVRASVTDEGIGIAEEDMAQLFTKFYRIDSKLTCEIGGTGLGLSIVKSIIELLGGEVGCKSTSGEGSTFWFTLPRASSDLVRMPTIEGPGGVGGTILVVDQNPEVADLIETYLFKRGYDVIKAHSVEEAFDLAVAEAPAVITMDVMLEDGRGFDLLKKLTDTPMTSRIPVVVLSTICDEGRSQRMGATGYLEKPIDKDKLASIIDDLVGSVASPVVMVVDDDKRINDLLCTNLKSLGYAVIAAYDGREAMVAVRTKHPDMILLDLRMPVMDGYQVMEGLKGNPETSDIPVVIMTAYHLDESRAGILDFAAAQISKPVDEDKLVERIQQLLISRKSR